MSPPTYLVTGANRGLGLGFTIRLLANERDARVVATARNPDTAAELHALAEANQGRLAVVKLDLVRESLLL